MKLKLSFSIITDVSDSYQNKILRSMVNGSVKEIKKYMVPHLYFRQ